MNKKKWITVVGVVITGAVGSYFYFNTSSRNAPHFKTIQVIRGDMDVKILSTATVAPENRLNIQSPIAGRAEQVLVDQGFTVKKGQVLAWVSSTERAALLDAAHSVGPDEVKKWEELYKPTPILAPLNGMIIQRNVQPGQTFATSDAILVMSDHLIVQATVDETDISQIKLQQAAAITLDAYPTEVIEGKVNKIAYDAKTVNNVTTYLIDVLPTRVPAYMRSGMTANVSFPIGVKTGVLIVPSDVIKSKDGRPFVLVPSAEAKGKPDRRDITLGNSDGKRVEIASGLSEGDSVLQPEFKLGAPKTSSGSPLSPMGTGGRH